MASRRMRTWVIACALVSTTILLPTKEVGARQVECGICVDWGTWTGYEHVFGSLSNELYKPPYHSTFVWGFCAQHDNPCAETQFDREGGFKRVEWLVSTGDWASLRELTHKVSVVQFNSERHAVQIENCTHDIVASYELPTNAEKIMALKD